MPTDRAIAATPRRRHRQAAAPGDGGFSVLEVMVAIAIIGTLMTALTPFLTRSMVVVNDQRSEQAAVAVANDAVERVRALDPSSLLAGRSDQATAAQWAAAPPEVDVFLDDTRREWDAMLPASSTAGTRAPLPTTPTEFRVGNAVYDQNWYVGRCWQPRTDPTQTEAAVPDCTAPASPAATDVPFFRVVVSVVRREPACDRERCIYVTSTLVSTAADPTFDMNRPPPTITTPGNQYGYVGDPVTLALTATGGWMPRTWSASGLPAGLTLNVSTGVITGTPTTVGSSSVTVVVTDRDEKSDDITFTWAVAAALPALTSPGDQTTRTGTAVSLAVPVSGGHLPRTWAATGLPGGLSINPSTGVITGTSSSAQVQTSFQPVTVTVTDAGTRTASVTFGWRVLTPVQITGVTGTYSTSNNTNVGNFTPGVSGGLSPYSWTAANLPDGLSINPSTGAVTGTTRSGSRYITTVTVRDSAGGAHTITVVVTITANPSGDLRFTNPAPDNTADRSTALNADVSLTAAATPGSNGTWSATGLPPGLALDASTGAITGKPTVRGTYLTTLVIQRNSKTAYLMFTWRIT